jgi:TPR repeat protein
MAKEPTELRPKTVRPIAFLFVLQLFLSSTVFAQDVNDFINKFQGTVEQTTRRAVQGQIAQQHTVQPSFNCAKARAPDELAICSNPELSELDNAVVAGYEYVRRANGDLFARQTNAPFFQARQACGADADCIKGRQVDAISRYHDLGAPVSSSDWAHNGSQMRLVANRRSRKFFYETPRAEMLSAGAKSGSLLFEGEAIDEQYVGTAYIFNSRCGQIAYQVSGPIVDNFERVVLQGLAPRIGPNCLPRGYIADSSEFKLLKPVDVAQSPNVDEQAGTARPAQAPPPFPAQRAETAAPSCGVDPSIYPRLKASMEEAAQSALKEVPNGSADELWAVYSSHLKSELPDPRTLDAPTRMAYEHAFTSLGSNQQLLACFPALAPFVELYESRLPKLEATGKEPEPPQINSACNGPLSEPKVRALGEGIARRFLAKVKASPPSRDTGTYTSDGIFSAFLEQLENQLGPNDSLRPVAARLRERLALDPDTIKSQIRACFPVIAQAIKIGDEAWRAVQKQREEAAATCPLSALLSENVQRYEKAYAQEILKKLRTKPTFTDEYHTISARELVKPMYDYMVINHWPTEVTMALSKFMAGSGENFAACFPELAKIQEPLQQGLQQQKNAIEQYRKAAEQGSALAQTNLGDIYFKGQGAPQDYQQALSWYRKAADQGMAAAQYNLGYMYRKGLGVPQDYQQALSWYRKAADQGWAQAQTEFGFMYTTGLSVPQDYQQAFSWYRKAADQGVAAAQYSLGLAYEKGYGVPQDYTQAATWYRKAAEQGYGEAKTHLDGLAYEEAQSKRDKLAYEEEKRKGASAAAAARDAARTMKLPNMWAYQGALMERYPPYYQCNYTTKTCLRGKGNGSAFIGETLAEDRQTVLAHIMCNGDECINFDTGLRTFGDRVIESPKDTPYVCIEVLRDLGESCDLRPVAIGSRWMISPGVIRCKERSWNYTGRSCHSGNFENVVVDKVDNGAQACVHVEGQHDCFWVSKNNLSGPLPPQ